MLMIYYKNKKIISECFYRLQHNSLRDFENKLKYKIYLCVYSLYKSRAQNFHEIV